MTTELCGVTLCDTDLNYCYSGACIGKKTVMYAVVGIFILMLMAKRSGRRREW